MDNTTPETQVSIERAPAVTAPTRQMRLAAECIGTFWLVFGGCGSAVIAAGGPGGIGLVGVSLAFGLTVLTMAYALGHISGCHLNPAVTMGMCAAKRFPLKDAAPYVLAQLVGGFLGALAVYVIATGAADYDISLHGLAENGYGPGSPAEYSLGAAALIEFILTLGFILVIAGATDPRAPAGMAPLAIGLALTLIHLISIPVTNTSVNPARSTGPALIAGGLALQQLWLFWVAPLAGGLAGGGLYALLFGERTAGE